MKYNNTMDFIHHVIRPLWSLPIGLIYLLVCALIYLFSKKKRADYKKNKEEFKWPVSLEVFASNFKNVHKYRWDGISGIIEWLDTKRTNRFIYNYKVIDFLIKILTPIRGILDHDNFELEIFMYGDDCDRAKHTAEVLNKKGFEAFRVGMIGKNITSWHFDCIIKPAPWENNQEYALFNYGNLIYGSSVEDCLQKLSKLKGWDKLYKAETMSWWQCKI